MISTSTRRPDPLPARATFPPTGTSPHHARAFVANRLHEWQGDAADDSHPASDADDELVMLLVSELVTNAVLHACTPAEVEIDCSQDALRVSVSDGVTAGIDPEVANRKIPIGAPSGRGLHIVDALADRWGVSVGESGKTVWFEMLLDAPPTDNRA